MIDSECLYVMCVFMIRKLPKRQKVADLAVKKFGAGSTIRERRPGERTQADVEKVVLLSNRVYFSPPHIIPV